MMRVKKNGSLPIALALISTILLVGTTGVHESGRLDTGGRGEFYSTPNLRKQEAGKAALPAAAPAVKSRRESRAIGRSRRALSGRKAWE